MGFFKEAGPLPLSILQKGYVNPKYPKDPGSLSFLTEDTPIEDFIRYIRSAHFDLAALGYLMPDSEFALTILTCLPPSWDQFIITIDATEI